MIYQLTKQTRRINVEIQKLFDENFKKKRIIVLQAIDNEKFV